MPSKEEKARAGYITSLGLSAPAAAVLSNQDLRRWDAIGRLGVAPGDVAGYSYRDLVLQAGNVVPPALVGQISWAQFKVV